MKVPFRIRIVVYGCVIFASVATAASIKQIRINQRVVEAVRRVEAQLAQDEKAQQDALALLAKIDGKVKFDPAHPKRVIAIDI